MNYNEYLQLLLDAALDIKAGNFNKKYGICKNLGDKVINVIDDEQITINPWEILTQAFYTWPQFSGDVQFPIDDPYEIETADDAYARLPKWTGAYGKLRWELLDHIINFIEKEIEKEIKCESL